MGAERWLDFEDNEAVREYLAGIETLGDPAEADCWFDWKRGHLEVGYAMGFKSGEWAAVVCRELLRRFPGKRIGSDSVGWFSDAEMEGEPYCRYPTWVEWLKHYKPFARYEGSDLMNLYPNATDRIEDQAAAAFRDLDLRDSEVLAARGEAPRIPRGMALLRVRR